MSTSLTKRTRALRFHSTSLAVIRRDGEVWLRGRQIDGALGYKHDTVSRLYQRHASEFTDRMTCTVKLTEQGQEREVRVFSLRGAHLLAMFARTERAAEFRKWVLDVLDEQATGQPPTPPALPAPKPQRAAAPALPPPAPRVRTARDAEGQPLPLRPLTQSQQSQVNSRAMALSRQAYEDLREWLMRRLPHVCRLDRTDAELPVAVHHALEAQKFEDWASEGLVERVKQLILFVEIAEVSSHRLSRELRGFLKDKLPGVELADPHAMAERTAPLRAALGVPDRDLPGEP